MLRVDRRIDVTTAASELGVALEMAVTLTLPDPAAMPERPIALFACPGGGYSRHYFMMRFAGHENYDEAAWHAERGFIHVAIDHVGVGESTIPDLSKIGFQTMAATHDACVRTVAAALRDGTLVDGFPAVPALFVAGTGQSMGAAVTILTQGRFATFHGIAPLGVSAIHTALPQRDAAAFEHGVRRFDAVIGGIATSRRELDLAGVDYVYAFHWEDVPADIVEEDMRGGYPFRRTVPRHGSATIPDCAVGLMVPGPLADDAARVAVPVFIGVAERDVCPAPHEEPSAYRSSSDVSLLIVPRMAHMHNFASTRETLWKRLHHWCRTVAAGSPAN